MLTYAPLHHHSHYSHDGAGTAKQAALYAKAMGLPALALTDHGTISGVVEHYLACKEAGIKPIIGCEMYYLDGDQRYHMTMLARNNQGYATLCKLLTEANRLYWVYKGHAMPAVTLDMLRQWHDGLIVLTGCISGYVPHLVLHNNGGLAFSFVQELQKIFSPEHVFLEVQPFEAPDQKLVNTWCVAVYHNNRIPLVMTGDSHYVQEQDTANHRVMLQMRHYNVDRLADYSKRYIHTPVGMMNAWMDMMGAGASTNQAGLIALANTTRIADMCDVTLEAPVEMPVLSDIAKPRLQLVVETKEGLKRKNKYHGPYVDRARYELDTLLKKDMDSYMLLCRDIIQYGLAHDIPMAARGSVCGSLVAYALDISLVDPLIHGTMFERFVGPNRTDWPDIDIDIPDKHKDDVMSYLKDKYRGNATQISTFGRWKGMNLANGLAKIFNVDKVALTAWKNLLGVMLWEQESFNLNTLLNYKGMAQLQQSYPGLLEAFCYLYGQVSIIGQHPAGIAITRKPLDQKVAVVRVGTEYQTCFDLKSLETLGVMKIDCLGSANLATLHDAEKYAGVVYSDAMLEDTPSLDAFARGDTIGIFQMEKAGARQMLRDFKPRSLLDIALINAINRPGAGNLDEVIKGRNKGTKDDELSKLTQESYGVFVYQEQIIAVLKYSGMCWADIDRVLKLLKHVQDNDPQLEQSFVSGMVRYGYSASDMHSMWHKMRRYLFNKSHAVSYAIIAMREMFLKVNHPFAWYMALLENENNADRQKIYQADAVRTGKVIILPPHVNGGANFQRIKSNGKLYIQAGLMTLDGVGASVASALVAERISNGPYTSKEELLTRFKTRKAADKAAGARVRTPLTKKVLATLEDSGCLFFEKDQYQKHLTRFNQQLMQVPLYIP
jgi:DNA polymerase-3 subunit alpha